MSKSFQSDEGHDPIDDDKRVITFQLEESNQESGTIPGANTESKFI